MGVAGILPRLAPVIHKINIRNLRNDSCRGHHTPSSKSNQGREGEHRGLKRKLTAIHGVNSSGCASKPSKIRVGIDILTWVAKACHGRGAILLDERHLTNYGRAEMIREKKLQYQKKRVRNDSKSNENIASDGNTITNIERQRELQLEFVSDTAKSVVRKVISLKSNLDANILVVFDGASPPIKHKCCRSRKSKRDSAVMVRDKLNETQPEVMGGESYENGPQVIDVEKNVINLNNKISAAKRAGAHSNDIQCSVVSAVMKLLRDEKISFLVAPYEADGQLAYLSNSGFLDLIVSEDSDFIGYGVEAILYKYKDIVDEKEYRETDLGLTGDLLRKSDFGATSSSFSLAKFSDVMLSVLFVAAGCDYCDSLRGIGIVTARNIVEEAFDNDQSTGQKPILKWVIYCLFRASTAKLSKEEKRDYEYMFLAALAMFRHPVVFDPLLGRCLSKGPPDPELMKYKPYNHIIANESNLSEIVGHPYSRELGIYVAEGWINPRTWSLWNKENETPANVLEVWRNKSLSVQVTVMKSISRQNNVEKKMKMHEGGVPVSKAGTHAFLSTRNENQGKIVEEIHVSHQSESEEQIETQEIKMSPILHHKESIWKTYARDSANRNIHDSLEMQRNLENDNKDKATGVMIMCGQNDVEDHLKMKEVKIPIFSHYKGRFVPVLQSQFSDCTSSASKPSTQQSNQSSIESADVISPNLLPSTPSFHAYFGTKTIEKG